MKRLINLFLVAVIVVGTGIGPNMPMARRAAIVDCYKQFSAQGISSGWHVVSEGYADDGSYKVTMER